MRVLQVHTRYREQGGEDVVVATERALLEEAGHEVATHLLDNPGGPRAAATLVAAPWNASAARGLRRRVADDRPDVVHVHNTWFALSPAGLAAVDGLDVPLVATLHNYRLLCVNATLFRDGARCHDCVGHLPWRGVVHRCYRGSVSASAAVALTTGVHRARGTWSGTPDVLVAISEAQREILVRGGVPADVLVVKPNTVADPGARPAPPSASRRLLVVGRLSPERGVATALAAWARADTTDARLVVVGDGAQRAELERTAPAGVRFAGSLPAAEVRGLMASSRALLFPTRWDEPFGLVVVEAAAAGMPVVASRMGATSEILGGEAGWLLPPDDVDAWAAAIGEVLARGEEVDRRGAAGRARYLDRYSDAAGIAALEALYEEAVRRRSRR